MYAKFSPDSSNIAYMYENNLYIESVDGKNSKQLTLDGSELIVNGTGDWVNEEEFSLRDGFTWSPDSTRLCYWQFDTEGVGTFYMMKNTDDVYSTTNTTAIPQGRYNKLCNQSRRGRH